MSAFLGLIVFVTGVFAGQLLQYDDGTATWFSFDGKYRGVAFDVGHFNPDASGFDLNTVEYWFYNSGIPLWDTDQFYAEVWEGGVGGPVGLLATQTVTALHFSPCYLQLSDPLTTGTGFWCLVNTELSANGSPSLLGDDVTDHDRSLFSSNMTSWTAWTLGDYLVRADGEYFFSLETGSWAAIKALF